MEPLRNSNLHSNSLDFFEDEIIIYLKVMKTVAVKVKRSETIRNLKAIICEKEGISENLQELVFAGNRLNDEKRLVDYGIYKDSTLHLDLQNFAGMKIFVKIPQNQKTIEVEARMYDTIQDIKSIIMVKEGIPSPHYTLLYAGKLLEDDRTLASLSMQNESTLHLVFNPKAMLSFSVKTPNEDIVDLKLNILCSVADVKTMVGSMVGLSIRNWNLTHAGKQLEDSETLACYNIEEESILEMSPPKIQIFVKAWSGKTITVDVHRCETIRNVKNRIFLKLGVRDHFQSIVFGGKKLDEDRHVADYNIEKHATLHLVFSPSTVITHMTLFDIEGSAGIPDSTTSIRYLKAMIQTILSSPVKEVYACGKLLQDEFSLADYNIGKDETFTIVSEQRGLRNRA